MASLKKIIMIKRISSRHYQLLLECNHAVVRQLHLLDQESYLKNYKALCRICNNKNERANMLLSDSETKKFYEKFEELKKIVSRMNENKKYVTKQISVTQLERAEELTEQIHKIIYENLEE